MWRPAEGHLEGFGARRGYDFAVARPEPVKLSVTNGEVATVLYHDVSVIDGTSVAGFRT
jgi:hypothetical protein